MDKNDKKLADDSLKTVHVENITEEHSLTTTEPQTLAQMIPGVPIQGFNELPMSMLVLPSCVLVQGLTDVYLADGKTSAPKGEWWFSDSRVTTKEINFVSLRAVVRETDFVDDQGLTKKRTKLYCLCANANDNWDLFVLILPVTSFTAWGRMMAQMKKSGAKNSFEYITRGRIQQQANKKGQKYFIGDFIIGDKLLQEDLDVMSGKYREYGGVLDRRDFVDEVESQVDA